MKAIISANAKGGTGKTVIAINLATQLSKHGAVGILDADLDSSNLYEYMGLHGKMGLTEERKIIPLKHNGMEIFTMGGFLPDSDKGVSITGASMKQMLIDAVENVEWGELDFLVVDAPAGTSKERFVALTEVLEPILIGVVITTQPNIQDDVKRIYDLCSRYRVRILGLIENMKGVACSKGHPLRCEQCGEEGIEEIPLDHGIEDLCNALGLEYFGSIPISKSIRKNSILPEWAMAPVMGAVEKVIKTTRYKEKLSRRLLAWAKTGVQRSN